MHLKRILCPTFICAVITLAPASLQASQPGPAAKVVMVAGDGEIVQPNFQATVPMTILVTDANGIPVSGVPVSWSTSCGASDYACATWDTGTLLQPSNQTDSNGIATTNYTQQYVPQGDGYTQATITATTPVGIVNFKVTATEPFNGATLPFAAFILKPGALGMVTGSAGSTVAGGLQVSVSPASGFNAGQGIQNVGVRIIDTGTGLPSPAASCNAPAGIVLTDVKGNANCDIVLGHSPGTFHLAAKIGEATNPPFDVTITSGSLCTYSISPTNAPFPANGGQGFVTVTADPGCTWTVTTPAGSFITIVPGSSGVGNGTVNYTVGTNPGPARSGTISIAGQTFTVNQAGTGGSNLTITSAATLPGAVQNTPYSTTLTASGGTGTYTWAVTSGSLPPGLTLVNSANTAVISGTPSTTGNFPFTITVTDSANTPQSRAFAINVGVAGNTLTILTTSAANGIVGTAYTQPLIYSQPQNVSCGSPFGLPAFSVTSGSLPPGLSLQNNVISGTPTTAGTYPFTIVVGNSSCQSAPVTLTIVVTGATTSSLLTANPASLTFNVGLNAAAPSPQVVVISSTGSSVALTATVNVGWLAVSLSPSTTPAALTVNVVNYQSLAPGTYSGQITVQTTDNLNSLAIPVTLIVTGGPPPVGVTVSASALSFSVPPNSYSQQVISVLGSASAPNVAFLATASTSTGANWLGLSVVAGSAPAATVSSTTPANLGVSVNTTGLIGGRYTGTVVVQVQGSSLSLSIPITLVVAQNTLTADMQQLNFTFVPGIAPPASQVINLFSSIPVQVGVTATTAAGGDWLFTTLGSNTVPTAVTVSVSPAGLPRGTYNGTVTITAADPSIAPIKVPVTLTVTTGAGPAINGVVNAASNQPGPISPGEFITIYGSGLSSTTPALLTLTAGGLISNSLNSTQVLFDNIPSPLVYVAASQINAIVPYELYGRTSTQLQVSYNGGISTTVQLAVAGSAPGIFLCAGCQPATQAAALNQDGTPNSAANGARPGSVVTLFATGEGQTTPPGTTGAITGSTPAQPILPVTVRVGGLPANVTYAGAAPSLAEGVLQVNVTVPAGVPRGVSVPVTITIGTTASNQATIAIAP